MVVFPLAKERYLKRRISCWWDHTYLLCDVMWSCACMHPSRGHKSRCIVADRRESTDTIRSVAWGGAKMCSTWEYVESFSSRSTCKQQDDAVHPSIFIFLNEMPRHTLPWNDYRRRRRRPASSSPPSAAARRGVFFRKASSHNGRIIRIIVQRRRHRPCWHSPLPLRPPPPVLLPPPRRCIRCGEQGLPPWLPRASGVVLHVRRARARGVRRRRGLPEAAVEVVGHSSAVRAIRAHAQVGIGEVLGRLRGGGRPSPRGGGN